MAAKKKDMRAVQPAAVAARQRIASLYVPLKTEADEMLGGTPAEAAKALLRRLRDDRAGDRMILVIAEQRGGKLNRAIVGGHRRRAADRGRTRRIAIAVPGAGVRRGGRGAGRRRRGRGRHDRAPGPRPVHARRLRGGARTPRSRRSPSLVVLPHTYQTRDFAPTLAARLDRALVTDVIGLKALGRRARVRAADVSGQAGGGRGARRPDAAPGDVPDRRLPRRRRREGGVTRAGARAGRRGGRRRDPRRSRRRRSRRPSRRSICRRPSASCRSGRGIKGQEHLPLAQRTGRCARRGARGVAADLRRRLAADGAPGRQLRPDGGAEALSGARHLRRDSASGRHEGLAGHRRHQQGSRTRPSSKSPTTASSATSSRSCRRSSRRSKPDPWQPWRR